MWTADDIQVTLMEDLTDDPIVTVRIRTPAGNLRMMARVEVVGQMLRLSGLHIHGDDVGPGEFGRRALAALAMALLMEFDRYEGIEVEGAVRTTGAGPGHRPRPLRFTRAALLRHFRK